MNGESKSEQELVAAIERRDVLRAVIVQADLAGLTPDIAEAARLNALYQKACNEVDRLTDQLKKEDA